MLIHRWQSIQLRKNNPTPQRRQNPSRRHLPLIPRINLPLHPAHQLKQKNLHLEEHKALPETFPRVRIERDVRPTDRLAPEPRLHLAGRLSPTLRPEGHRVVAPDPRVGVHAERVPADERARGDRDLAAQDRRLEGYPVDQLRNGRVQAEELVDDGGEEGEFVQGFCWGLCVQGVEFGAEAGLDILPMSAYVKRHTETR